MSGVVFFLVPRIVEALAGYPFSARRLAALTGASPYAPIAHPIASSSLFFAS